jgi:hypothetical protein
MKFSMLLQRTPRRVLVAFLFAYVSVGVMTLLPVMKSLQMFWQ